MFAGLRSSKLTPRAADNVCGPHAPPIACPLRTLGRDARHATTCAVFNEVVQPLAGMNPSTVQDFLVGGAVVGTIGAALVAGLQKEPAVCDLCQGNGGARCFACSGEGKMPELISRDQLMAGQAKRDGMGRSGSDRNCKVCKGAGLIGCSKCRGSGYV